MNVTREVVTDLLPIYFSGEASADTRALVEDYFHRNPDFERIARSATRPLDALHGAALVAPEAEREKHDLECVRWEVGMRKWLFGAALLTTLVPLALVISNGHIVWAQMVRDDPWDTAFWWSFASVLWFVYFARLRRRTAALAFAIFFTLFPFRFAVHLFIPSWPRLNLNLAVAVVDWILAAYVWSVYLRLRNR